MKTQPLRAFANGVYVLAITPLFFLLLAKLIKARRQRQLNAMIFYATQLNLITGTKVVHI